MALGFRLSLKKLPDGRLCFAVPSGYRLLLLSIGLLILISLIVTAAAEDRRVFQRSNTVPLIFCLLSFLGASYHERWLFDRAGDRVTYQYGVSFFHRSRNYRISEMKKVELSQFIKGKLVATQLPKRSLSFRPVLTLALHAKNGSVFRLETYAAPQRRIIALTGMSIAEYCGLPFVSKLDSSTDQGSK